MKKILSSLVVIATLFTGNVFGQACAGGSGPGVCTPTGGPSSGGFEDPSATPCAVQGTAYSHGIQFSMFSVFNFLGTQSVDSIQFVAIDNLPCGLCWAVDQTDKTYSAGEDGCISITGTTNDADGQYKLMLTLKAWINNQPTGQTIPSTLVDQTGIKLLVRVKTAAGTCVNADTSSSANNLIANPANCNVGIHDVSSAFSALTLTPNPMTTSANLSFTSVTNGTYTLHVTDLTGKVVATQTVEVKQGENVVALERNNLQSGVYFVNLTNGTQHMTQRFCIAD